MHSTATARPHQTRAMSRLSRRSVRTRSTAAAAVVVTIGIVVASAVMLTVLYYTLQGSAQTAAQARAAELVEQLRTDRRPNSTLES